MSDHAEQDILEMSRRRLHILEQQKDTFGLYVPAHIQIEIENLQDVIGQVQQQRAQLVFQQRDLDLTPPPVARGLILLVSPRRSGDALHTLSTYQAIDYHRATLAHCWLIATNDSDATAKELRQHFGVYKVPCSVHTVVNGADAAETQALVSTIYAQIDEDGDLQVSDVVADITGSTKAMTAGLVLACGPTRRMQYMLFQEKGLPSLPVLLHTQSAKEP